MIWVFRMYDMRDTREVLINHANYRFSICDSRNLLAYHIFLFIILRLDRFSLLRKEISLEFESLTDLSTQLCSYYGHPIIKNKSSIKDALTALEDIALVMSNSQKPTKEERDELGLKKVSYLFLSLNIKGLLHWRPKGNIAYEHNPFISDLINKWQTTEVFENNYSYRAFDSKVMPILRSLSRIAFNKSLSLVAYQIALYFTFKKDQQLFKFSSYSRFIEELSPFVSLFEIAQTTVFRNLNTLAELGILNVYLINPKAELSLDEFKDHDSILAIEKRLIS